MSPRVEKNKLENTKHPQSNSGPTKTIATATNATHILKKA
jgi:hypothetical protein